MSKKHKIYIASPLFSTQDNAELDRVEELLDKLGITYFSPRKHSNIGPSLRDAKTPEEKDAAAQFIFDLNINAIHSSELVLVNTVGTRWNNSLYGDQGTLVEAGMAFALNIPVVTYNFYNYGLNIMLSQKAVYHCDNTTFENYDELNILKDILESINTQSTDPTELRKKFWKINDRELV